MPTVEFLNAGQKVDCGQYANLRKTLTDAAVEYQKDVSAGEYPGPEHSYED